MPACRALLIAAPASGQGKTTVTAALARLFTRQGRRVRVFKCGPDFLDAQIHALASAAPVYNLDLAMCGEDDARWRLAEAAENAELILVEGVMGLFDGQPSSADIAMRFGLPVLAVIDARAMAQTFGAVAYGLAHYKPGLPFAGVLANRVGTARHAGMLQAALPPGVAWFGALPRDEAASLPERHLGLLQAGEIADLAERLDSLADAIADCAAAALPSPVEFDAPPRPAPPPLLAGRRIAVARDAAYGFIYPANLDLLRELGAELVFFSPLAHEPLPACDALWLPGGYPELHAERLHAHPTLGAALREHLAAGRAILAECGGMMSLFETLVDVEGRARPMYGLLPGSCRMQTRLAALGVQYLDTPAGRICGHTFHYSRSDTTLAPWLRARRDDGSEGEAVYRQGGLVASYVHCYFPSNPRAVAALFGAGG